MLRPDLRLALGLFAATAASGADKESAPAPTPAPAPAPVASTADAAPVPLSYAELVLKDGRKLTKVAFKAYDAKAERFLVIAAGKAMTLPLAQVPDALAARLKEAAPQSGSSTSSAPTPPPGPVRIEPHPFENLRPAPARAPAPVPAPPAVSVDAHKAAALERARNYYRYEFPVGSDAARVTALNLEVGDPEPVPGWPNRLRMQGRTLLEWFDSKGWSYRRTTSTFEVTTETPANNGTPKVVDFSLKN